ncbi:MAG: nitroreductase family protein [Chloroflexota bacterium]|nr:MAG: nitroreductase family protein [Chloroflexota bacterium]
MRYLEGRRQDDRQARSDHLLERIERRRSIRKFTPQDVSDQQIRLLLSAGMAAPSGHNFQPWHFVVVREEDNRLALAETHGYAGMIKQAPAVIAVCADSEMSLHWLEDACLAAGNILLQATALGLGAVWVAVYPHAEHEIFVRGVLGIPERIRVVCLIPVGYPAEAKPPRTKYDPGKVHLERFGG